MRSTAPFTTTPTPMLTSWCIGEVRWGPNDTKLARTGPETSGAADPSPVSPRLGSPTPSKDSWSVPPVRFIVTTVNNGAPGVTQGDVLVVDDSLTQNGKIVGSDAETCTWTNPSKKQLNCVWTLSLFARGQVVLTGIINFNKQTNTLAVAGGTSTLSNARGFATVANHAFSGAPWRVARRMEAGARPALAAARRSASAG